MASKANIPNPRDVPRRILGVLALLAMMALLAVVVVVAGLLYRNWFGGPAPASQVAELSRLSTPPTAAPPAKPDLVVAEKPAPEPALPEPAASPLPPAAAPVADSERFKRIKGGMTFEEVRAIMGDDNLAISGSDRGDRIVQWKTPDGARFEARFKNNLLDRTTRLHVVRNVATPGEVPMPAPTNETAAARPPDVTATPETPQEEQPSEEAAEAVVENTAPLPARVTRIGGEAAARRAASKKARLPRFSREIDRGPHDVYILNPYSYPVKVGLRTSTKRGKDFSVPPQSLTTVYLPNAAYMLYFLNEEAPYALENAGGFVVDSPPDAIIFRLTSRGAAPSQEGGAS